MLLACHSVIHPIESFVSLFVVVLFALPGMRIASRALARTPRRVSEEPGLTGLAVAFSAADATIFAGFAFLVAGFSGTLDRWSGTIPGWAVVMGSAWLASFLALLGLRAQRPAVEGELSPVLRSTAKVIVCYTGLGLIFGAVVGSPLDVAFGSGIIGTLAAALGVIHGRQHREALPLRSFTEDRQAVTRSLGRVLRGGALPALAGCAISGVLLAVWILAPRLSASAVDGVLGGGVTLALLAVLTVALVPAHAISLLAFSDSARGRRVSLGDSLRDGLALAPRVAPLTFLLLATPFVWHVVVAVTGHRFDDECFLMAAILFVPPVLVLATRYALVAPALVAARSWSDALANARETSRGRRGVLGTLALVSVLALAISPVHDAILDAETVGRLRWGLQNAASDAEAWIFLARTLGKVLAAHPLALALEVVRLGFVLVANAALSAAAYVALEEVRPRAAAPAKVAIIFTP